MAVRSGLKESELYSFLNMAGKWAVFAKKYTGQAGWYCEKQSELEKVAYKAKWIFQTALGFIYFEEIEGRFYFQDSLIYSDYESNR